VVKVIEVSKRNKNLHGYDSYVNYKENTVYTRKNQTKQEKTTGLEHEKCHLRLRKKYPKESNVHFSKPVEKEIRTIPWVKKWKRYKNYTRGQMAEEVFCEVQGKIRGKEITRKEYNDAFKSQWPKTHKAFRKLEKKVY